MPSPKDLQLQQQYEIKLDLSKVPQNRRRLVKDEIGEFVVNQVLQHASRGSSPVKGEGSFKSLTKEYAKAEKGGRRLANLELEGDLLNAYGFRRSRNGVITGIMSAKERPKADGHNHLTPESERSVNPKRRIVPASDQKFNGIIERGIKRIVREHESPEPDVPRRTSRPEFSEQGDEATATTIPVSSLVGNEAAIERLLNELGIDDGGET